MALPESLLTTIQPYTMVTQDRLENLALLGKYLNTDQIPGDFVECGTYRGGTAAILSQFLEQSRHLWLYDSFAGMPETTEKDGNAAKQWVGKCVASERDVREVLQLVGTSPERYTIQPGWFETTFKQKLPQQVALLHCDADWYNSVLLVLETFYPLMPVGGCVILDDFGHWEGCREAFYEFCDRHQERPVLERVGTDQAFWIKGRTHNRVPILELNQHSVLPERLRSELQASHLQITQLQQQIRQLQSEMEAMRSSKFWRLRTQWARLKQTLVPNRH
jgi:O-methyltransferase